MFIIGFGRADNMNVDFLVGFFLSYILMLLIIIGVVIYYRKELRDERSYWKKLSKLKTELITSGFSNYLRESIKNRELEKEIQELKDARK